ncbi:MAG: 1-acyl-sn-glycerol-3-phosphate acyltransferase [Bacteroidota bacterium]|nr:1-acyl-sn-glycerol-3-phosphate acyltransferase [Bacteroidota bacterium]
MASSANKEDMRKDEKFIDIRKVFRDKNPALFELIPSFVINYLRRVVHEDQLNDFVARHRDLYGLDFVDAIIRDFNANVHVKGLENIRQDERYIVASNHPLGGLDAIAFMHVLGRVRQDLVFPVNDLLMNIENLRPLFIPINKHGSNAENVKVINETFESDKLLLYFPAGLVSRKQKGMIRDIPWKKTFLSKAKRFKRHVVPVHINGRNTNFFYRLANIRKALKIKANIEMLIPG